MGLLGWAQGGQSATGVSRTTQALPFKNWRDNNAGIGWISEFVDAIGQELDIMYARFISAQSRANLLNPAFASVEQATATSGTATAAPLLAASQDTMLDILAYITLGQYPLDTNLTIAQRQALIQVGWAVIARKTNRLQLLNLISQVTDGIVYGWTNPPSTFSFVIPDGLPSPGFGSWVYQGWSTARAGTVQVTNLSASVVGTSTSFTTDTFVGDHFTVDRLTNYVVTAIADNTHLTLHATYAGLSGSGKNYYGSASDAYRPWILGTIRNLATPYFPPAQMGVGYTQFRAGYSAAGETVMPSGARINLLANEHFATWSAGTPTSWTSTLTGGTTLMQNAGGTGSNINFDFSYFDAVYGLGGVPAGSGFTLASPATTINNQLTHRFQIDYAYTSVASVMTAQITDANTDGNTYYWNPTTSTWGTAAYSIPIPQSSGTRARFACDVIPQKTGATGTTFGTRQIKVTIGVTSDGTSTTQTVFVLFRVGLYEKFNLAQEQQAIGDRSLWLPLIDTPSWTNAARSGQTANIIEIANANRSAYRYSTTATFPYHPAISAHGFAPSSSWTNLLKGGNDFITDWVVTGTTHTANAVISPLIGETSPSAVLVTATTNNGNLHQQLTTTAANKTYCGGVWMKKISSDAALPTISIVMLSNVTTNTLVVPLKQAQGWQLIPFNFTFVAGDAVAPTLEFVLSASGGQIALANAYLYDVTGTTGVLYPPVVQSPVGSTATLNPTTCNALTASQGVNVLGPTLQRTLCSVQRGILAMTVAPTFDAGSQPSAVLFDCGQSTTQNRIYIQYINGTGLRATWLDSSTSQSVTLTATTSFTPGAGQFTWRRDTAFQVLLIWSPSELSLSAGSGSSTLSAITVGPSDASVANITIGNDVASANQFDGTITLLEVDQLGAPAS